MQTNNKKKISALVLHLRSDGSVGFKSANGTSMGKGITWGISEIRPEGFEITVRPLQPILRRNGGRVLQKNASRNRGKGNGKTPKGQAGKRKGTNSL